MRTREYTVCTYFALIFCLFVCLFLQRAWQGDEIASVHLSNIVGEDIADVHVHVDITCTLHLSCKSLVLKYFMK